MQPESRAYDSLAIMLPGWQRTASEQLQQVVSQTDQRPSPLHLFKGSQEEIAKPQTGFDLAEHWFDNHLAASIFGSPFLCPVSPSHLLSGCQVFRWSPLRRIRHFVMVLLTTRRDEHIVDPFMSIQRVHVRCAEVTRVGGERSDVFRDACFIEIVNRLIRKRHGLTNIVRPIGDIDRDDNLLLVRHRLSVPALVTVFDVMGPCSKSS